MKENNPYYNRLRRLLVLFLKAKNRIVKYSTGFDLFDELDYEEASKWQNDMIYKFFSNLAKTIRENDISLCPWCIYYNNQDVKKCCNDCGYGKRHLKCVTVYGFFGSGLNEKSRYGKIILNLRTHNMYAISDINKIKSLRQLTLDMYKKIKRYKNLAYKNVEKPFIDGGYL